MYKPTKATKIKANDNEVIAVISFDISSSKKAAGSNWYTKKGGLVST